MKTLCFTTLYHLQQLKGLFRKYYSFPNKTTSNSLICNYGTSVSFASIFYIVFVNNKTFFKLWWPSEETWSSSAISAGKSIKNFCWLLMLQNEILLGCKTKKSYSILIRIAGTINYVLWQAAWPQVDKRHFKRCRRTKVFKIWLGSPYNDTIHKTSPILTRACFWIVLWEASSGGNTKRVLVLQKSAMRKLANLNRQESRQLQRGICVN